MKSLQLVLIIILIPLLIIPVSLSAQSFSGVATYKSQTRFELNLDSTRIPPERIKEIKERMKDALIKDYTLTFNKSASIFKEVEQLQEGANQGRGFMMMITGGGGVVYKNIQEKKELEQTEFFGKVFLISEDMDLPQWKLGKETKQVGSYTCYKATTTRQRIVRKITTGKDGSSETDTSVTEIVAWYTPQIPLSHGPDVFWGLPGMIMEVTNGQTTFLCTRMELKKEDADINPPKKGEEVNRAEYTKIVEEKMVEMEQMRRQSGRGGGRGPGGGGKNTFEIIISR